MTKSFLTAIATAAVLSTSATAGNILPTIEEPDVPMVPEFNDTPTGSLSGSSNGVAIGLGLLLLGAVVASSGS